MFYYSIYGLQLTSNHALPGLLGLPEPDPDAEVVSSVRLELGSWPETFEPLLAQARQVQPWFTSDSLDTAGEPGLRTWKLAGDNFYWFRYSDGAEFIVASDGRQVWGYWPPTLSLWDAATYFYGAILGFVLRRRGATCLHASAVGIAGRAVLFIGQAGAGKSTLAAAFARQGYPVLCDNIAALVKSEVGLQVQSAYPFIRLWSDSVETLWGRADALPRILPAHPTWSKRYLDLSGPNYHFQAEPLPLGAIYMLDDRLAEDRAPYTEHASPRAALLNLLANIYPYGLSDLASQTRDFTLLGRVIKAGRVRSLHPHADPLRLPLMIQTIVADLEAHQTIDSIQINNE